MPAIPDVPVLDAGTVTATELLTALQQSSCVFLTGIPALDQPLGGLLSAAAAFFTEPAEVKDRVRWTGEGPWAGWQPLYEGTGSESLLLERYEFDLPAPVPGEDDTAWSARFTQWPDQPADFPRAATAYYRAMRGLANRITVLLAEALGVPAGDLEAWTDRQHSNLCVNHYLAQAEPPAEGRTRQHSHTDMGGLTLLWADDQPGLEARIGADGEWVPVTFPPGAMLVQAGDLLHLWSGGTIPANEHRVVLPPSTPGTELPERYSVVYFHHPDLDTWVAPALPGTATVAGGTGAFEHVMERQRTAYAGAAPTSRP